ncbi:MAG: hypothetical protein ACTH0V_00145 [Microbacteriaceae bacterium]
MREFDREDADTTAAVVSAAVQEALGASGEYVGPVFAVDPRESAGGLAASVAILLPESFGEGDVREALLEFFRTYLRTAKEREEAVDAASAEVVAAAEELLGRR